HSINSNSSISHSVQVQRAESLGYFAETHEVVTEDGYILQMHRIMGSRKSPRADNKPAVLVVHGLLDCSAGWVVAIPEKSLGYILADWGYDVWLASIRGTRYSRNHKWLTTKDSRYWMFSWHEIGFYDLPAMIDGILNVTKQKKILYIGFSQGGTSFLVMASERPEYQEKLEAAFPLAPASFMSHTTNPFIQLLAPHANNLNELASLIGMHEFQPSGKLLQTIAGKMCSDPIIGKLCSSLLILIAGKNDKQLNTTLIPEILQYSPAGAGTRQFVHYAQLINSGNFAQYDHGLIGNMKQYGHIRPPKYNLDRIKMPVYIFYGSNDEFVSVKDINKLYNMMPNAERFLVPYKWFTHLDFMWAKNVDTMLYNRLVSLMERHRKNLLTSN
ncbi:Lipase 3, partial [Dufourea novaeangliae]